MFPAHADLQPILGKIREKYDLPKLGLMDKEISDLLLADKNIPGMRSENKLEMG